MRGRTASADRWSGTVALGNGVVVYVGPGATAAEHRHDAIQIIWSPYRPVFVGVEGGPRALVHAAVVPSGASHDFESDGAPIGIVLVEPSGRLGRRLDTVAREPLALTNQRPTGRAVPTTTDASAIVDWALALVTSIVSDAETAGVDDVRGELREARRFIDAHLDGAPPLAETALHVGLSPRQLRRGFADEIGMPYRRYVLWRRLHGAVRAVRAGADLTSAAAAAGFADSAHLSRTFRQTFGLTPSEVLPLLTVVGN